jgi:hypothetical protein
VRYDHLLSLTDGQGVFEHCSGRTPRIEHGYCVDDVARAWIVAERGIPHDPDLDFVADTCSRFLAEATTEQGTVRNRRDVQGRWHGPANTADHWGRALWAWGSVLAETTDSTRREAAENGWQRAARQRSPFVRAMAFAGLGAGEVLRVRPYDSLAISLLVDAASMIPPIRSATWPWPEPRLTYANPVIPQVLMLAGHHTNDPELTQRGVDSLTWLTAVQKRGQHLSVIPNSGWAYPQPLPDFDQQPIEVAALVEAALVAHQVTGDPIWQEVMTAGVTWFLGDNDTGAAMADPTDGAGFDGLTWTGHNLNAGAESTLAYLSVMQRARQVLTT